jgi:hypothetical protein
MNARIGFVRLVRRGSFGDQRWNAIAVLAILAVGCRPPSSSLRPDIEVSSLATPSSAVAADFQWTLGATVVNTGAGTAATSELEYWYSDNGTLDAGDTLVTVSTIPALGPGASYVDVWSTAYAVEDSGGGPGTHWIFAVADAGGAVGETDETNNLRGKAVVVLYGRLIIDTYRPKTDVIVTDTFLSLFDAAGDPTTETGTGLWYNDNPPFTVDAPPVSIAEADVGNPFWNSARIDYEVGLAPGTYYIRVRGQRSTTTGVYAVRVLLVPDDIDYGPWYFSDITDDAEYEVDDNPPTGGIPTNPVVIAIGGKLNRALTAGDVDWLKLVLP